MPLRSQSEIFDVTVEMVGETAKAIKYFDGSREFWVPKSMIAHDDIQVTQNATGTLTLTAPTWFLKERGVL